MMRQWQAKASRTVLLRPYGGFASAEEALWGVLMSRNFPVTPQAAGR